MENLIVQQDIGNVEQKLLHQHIGLAMVQHLVQHAQVWDLVLVIDAQVARHLSVPAARGKIMQPSVRQNSVPCHSLHAWTAQAAHQRAAKRQGRSQCDQDAR